MKIILHTDCLYLIENPNNNEAKMLKKKLENHKSDEISTTIISFDEQITSWIDLQKGKNSDEEKFESYKKLFQFVENFQNYPILKFDDDARKEYEKLKPKMVGKNESDLRIAAIALSQKAILICYKPEEFETIPNLIVLDWTK